MITAEDIYNYNEQLLFPKGFVLTERAIDRIGFFAIPSIRIEDDIIIPPENLGVTVEQEFSYNTRVANSQEFQEFKEEFNLTVASIKEEFSLIVTKNVAIDTDLLLQNTLHLVDLGSQSYGLFDLLSSLKDSDDETYVHSLTVALYCNILSKWLHLSENATKMATLCGLFADIGKVKIPQAILCKRTPLTDTEWKILQTHVLEGYRLLKDRPLDPQISSCALMHHERCDGTGYPFGVTSEKISPFAKIVAIVDAYCGMTAMRPYRPPLSPFQAIAIMEDDSLQKYDARFIRPFLRNVAETYIGSSVRLSDGRIGDIVYIHCDNLSRPTLKIGEEFLDLATAPHLEIISIA